jgi:hypothetical protein
MIALSFLGNLEVDINAFACFFQFHLNSFLSNFISFSCRFHISQLLLLISLRGSLEIGNCLRACKNIRRHVLQFELDLHVYVELLQPLLDVLEEQTNPMEEENSDLDVLV